MISIITNVFLALICLSPKSFMYAQQVDTDTFLVHALSWMTFRENGVLLTEAQLRKNWLDKPLKEKLKDKFYPVFVSAFQHGLVLAMALNENDACDPSYRMKYKYWYNDSTTEHFLIHFVMKNFYHRYYPLTTLPPSYCDYRQGLICSRTSKKCECPPGSTMSPLPNAPFPPNKRCLLKENEICALMDTAANGGKNKALKVALPFLIFDPEKPLGCVEGTQCRFKAGNMLSPLCYKSAGSPVWDDGPVSIPFGEECTLNLNADHGMCDPNRKIAWKYQIVCYNYGLAPSISAGTAPNKTGICTGHVGVFGGPGVDFTYSHKFGDGFKQFKPIFLMAFITPRFLPLRGLKLYQFHSDMIEVERYYLQIYGVDKNMPCSVERTDKVIALFRFLRSLQGPVLGEGPVITVDEAKVNATLLDARDIVREKFNGSVGGNLKICNIIENGYSCVATGKPADADGNDGTCRLPFVESKVLWDKYYEPYKQLYQDALNLPFKLQRRIELDERILLMNGGNNISGHCDPRRVGTQRCSADEACSFDYTDFTEDGQPIYQDDNCNFVPGHKPIYKCKNLSQNALWDFGACEQKVLEEKIEQVLEEIFQRGRGKYLKLERDEPCNYTTEPILKEAFGDLALVNGYKFLKHVNKHSADDGLCDSTRLLECKQDNKCGCVNGTKPRMNGDGMYTSDYCYLMDFQSCAGDVTQLVHALPYERKEMHLHYGNPEKIGVKGDECANGNVCMFVSTNKWRRWCTDKNTGVTGSEWEPPDGSTTPEPFLYTNPTARIRRTFAPPTRYRGGARLTIAVNKVIITILFVHVALEFLQ